MVEAHVSCRWSKRVHVFGESSLVRNGTVRITMNTNELKGGLGMHL